LGRKLQALGEAGQEKAVIPAINAGSLALAREAFIEFNKSSCPLGKFHLLPHVAAETGNDNFRAIYETVNGEVRAALTEASEFDAKKIVRGKFKNSSDGQHYLDNVVI
jgi:hypothetical protein